jgi:hypothetical protein
MQAEYDALRAYAAAARSGPFGAPRPCALVPDPQGGAALVTSWISCPRADDRLAPAMPLAGVRPEVLRRAAGWLADFHRVGSAEEVPLRAVLDLASTERELRSLLGTGGWVHDAGFNALAEGCATVRVTTIHGDFLPQNLFLCREATIGIDFTLEVAGPALRDVGFFLANMLWRGYSTLDPWRPARFVQDARTFIDAYYGGAAPAGGQAARLFLLAELARKGANLSSKIAGRRLGISDRLHRTMITGAIRELLRQDRAFARSWSV